MCALKIKQWRLVSLHIFLRAFLTFSDRSRPPPLPSTRYFTLNKVEHNRSEKELCQEKREKESEI